MSKTGRVTTYIAVSVVSAYLIASIAAGIFLANVALHPIRRTLENPAKLLTESVSSDDPLQNVSISAKDGITLQGWYLRPQSFSGSSVILLHGQADNREGTEGYAWMFLRHGYAVLMPDSRAHGESGGSIATYGVLERDDIKRWSEWLLTRTPGCEYLFGESMGAAISIQASTGTHDLCAVAAEDSFENFREIAYDRIAQQTGLSELWASILGRPTVEAGLAYTHIRYGVSLAEASPIEIIANSQVPTLLISGTADTNIPMRHSMALHKAGQGHTELWVVDGAEHTGAMQANPREFEQRVIQWFGTHQTPVSN
jgi:uncharacterized protein